MAVDLRALPEEELFEVMGCNVANARNPSAMVRSRIQVGCLGVFGGSSFFSNSYREKSILKRNLLLVKDFFSRRIFQVSLVRGVNKVACDRITWVWKVLFPSRGRQTTTEPCLSQAVRGRAKLVQGVEASRCVGVFQF